MKQPLLIHDPFKAFVNADRMGMDIGLIRNQYGLKPHFPELLSQHLFFIIQKDVFVKYFFYFPRRENACL